MSASVPVYCLVVREVREWVEVYAVTLEDGIEEAEKLHGVKRVEEASYTPGGVVT